MQWIKFDYNDGADVYYQIDKEEETVTFKAQIDDSILGEVTVFFDELKEVYEKIK